MLISKDNLLVKGFSLIELMIVLSIVAILSSLSLPAFHTWIADAQVKSASEHLMSGIRLAQAQAIQSGQRIEFYLTQEAPVLGAAENAAGKNWVIQSMDLLQPTQTEALIQAGMMGDSYANIAVQANVAKLAFNAIGRITNIAQNAQIDITHPASSNPFRIDVTTTGSVRLCNPDKSRETVPSGC